MDRKHWKILGLVSLFAVRHFLLGAGVLAAFTAMLHESLWQAAVAAICLIAARILSPANYGRIFNIEDARRALTYVDSPRHIKSATQPQNVPLPAIGDDGCHFCRLAILRSGSTPPRLGYISNRNVRLR